MSVLFLSVLISCSSESTDDGGPTDDDGTGGTDEITSLTIESTSEKVLTGFDVDLVATDQDGNDVTSDVTFEVDGSPLSAPVFNASAEGTFNVVAKVDDVTSNSLDIEAMSAPSTKRGLIEDYTATWCIYCPRIAKGIEAIESMTDDITVVAYHSSDPMTFSQMGPLANEYGVTGLPTGVLNRNAIWSGNEATNTTQPMNMLNGTLQAGISISTSLNGSVAEATIDVGYLTDVNSSKVVALLVEDGLDYPQRNATSYYGGVDPISPYIHNGTARKYFTDLFGDAVGSEDGSAGSVYSTTVSTTVSGAFDTNNMRVVAFLVNSQGAVINVQEVALGSSIGFE